MSRQLPRPTTPPTALTLLARRVQRLERERSQLRRLLREAHEGLGLNACDYDAHGRCQTHGLSQRPCIQARIARALAPAPKLRRILTHAFHH